MKLLANILRKDMEVTEISIEKYIFRNLKNEQ
jgi:hypothetical protein